MTWSTFPTSHVTTWGPPNGGVPSPYAQSPNPAGFRFVVDEENRIMFHEACWAPVPTTTYTHTKVGHVIAAPEMMPMIAWPMGPVPPGQSQAPYYFFHQHQIASEVSKLSTTQTPSPFQLNSAGPCTGPGADTDRAPGGAYNNSPKTHPGTGTGTGTGTADAPQVYLVPGATFLAGVDAHGNLKTVFTGVHSAANLPPGISTAGQPGVGNAPHCPG
ncbi:hypothetical protein PABG_05713 [Paracoccidioides brasiliensis Pb03]|nr:hypothetical protein PABG_05713 [Paracoccidioides brasiliensis Pb03]